MANDAVDIIIDGGSVTRHGHGLKGSWDEVDEMVIVSLRDLEALEGFVRRSLEADDEQDQMILEREQRLLARIRELEEALADIAEHTADDCLYADMARDALAGGDE